MTDQSAGRRPFEDVLAAVTPEWMDRPGVHGVGEGTHEGARCIVVLADPAIDDLPDSVEGVAVVVRVSGEIRASPDEDRAR